MREQNMYDLISKLVVYRNIGDDSILVKLAEVCRDYQDWKQGKAGLGGSIPEEKGAAARNDNGLTEHNEQTELAALTDDIYNPRDLASRALNEVHRLLDLATRYGFDGNLWHNYLAYILAMTVTPFTLVSEKTEAGEGSVNAFAKGDFLIFKELFDYDFRPMEEDLKPWLGIDCFTALSDFHAMAKREQIFNKAVSYRVRGLSRRIEEAKDADQVFVTVTEFYRDYGVGKYGLNKAFRLSEESERKGSGERDETFDTLFDGWGGLVNPLTGLPDSPYENSSLLIPITNTSDVRLEDLVGYEIQKKQLVANTEAFVEGRKANNVLLYGDAGTGKSTSVKAVLNQYYSRGLRMIEIYKHQFKDLARVITEIKNRNYRFIYMDDLSFEEFEVDYKYLKAVIEGGIEPYPENVLIYATSNRRHLIRETWTDRYDEAKEDMHRNDTVQEKLSLAGRFGLSIGYFAPTPMEYDEIVRELAARCPEITMDPDELRKQAHAWELRHGGYSGRAAQQFVNYLAGTVYGTKA